MSVRSMMRHRVTLKKPFVTKDAAGGKVTEYVSTEYTDVPAFVQPASSNTSLQYARRDMRVTHTVFFASEMPEVQAGWQVLYGNRVLIVEGYRDASAGTENAWAIDCDEDYRGNS